MNFRQNFSRLFSALIVTVFCFAAATAQTPNPPTKIVEITKNEKDTAEPKIDPMPAPAVIEPITIPTPPVAESPKNSVGVGEKLPEDVPDNMKANRRGQLSEDEAAIVPYYNNFLKEYYLGPEDVISVSVFGQDKYSKGPITVPPDGRISYPLIRDGIIVVGKTTQQVADEITKKLDEFIIDPKVTVFLDRAVSARYSVLGDVGRPGAQIMTRRLSVYEAIAEAGGILPTGNKKQVIVLRRGQDGRPYPIPVNLKDIESGKVKEEVFLVPGDQIIVPGNKIKAWQKILDTLPVIAFARGIFTGGLF